MARAKPSSAAVSPSIAIGADPGARHRRDFNPHIHGARGLFSLMVYFHHVANSGLPTFSYFGADATHLTFIAFQFGVELFFGISGIVIIGALERAPSIRAFAWDRMTRIYPVLWATLLVIILLSVLAGRELIPSWAIFANFIQPPPFFLIPQINPAAWSLGYEFFFYALVALGWLWYKKFGSLLVPVLIGICVTVMLPRAILMLPGIYIALRAREGTALARIARAPGIAFILFMILWTSTSLIQFGTSESLLLFGPPYIELTRWLVSVPTMILAGFFGTLSLTGIYLGQGLFSRFLSTPILLWLGTISYSFYLWHPVVMAVAKNFLVATGAAELAGEAAQLVFFVIALPPSLVLAFLSQRWLEKELTAFLRTIGPQKYARQVSRA